MNLLVLEKELIKHISYTTIIRTYTCKYLL